ELNAELAVRARAITWLGWTGGWGRPPREISLDPALPPARALGALLDDIDEGNVEVSEEDRAAAARIAAAYTSALYATPRPQDAVEAIDASRTRDGSPAAGLGDESAGLEDEAAWSGAATAGSEAASAGSEPAPDDSEASAASEASTASEASAAPETSIASDASGASVSPPTTDEPGTSVGSAASNASSAVDAPGGSGPSGAPQPALRADTDRLIALIRAAR